MNADVHPERVETADPDGSVAMGSRRGDGLGTHPSPTDADEVASIRRFLSTSRLLRGLYDKRSCQ